MKRLLALSALTILFGLAIFGRSLAVSDISYSIDSSYKVTSDGVGTVSHVINAKNTSAAPTPRVLKVPLAGSEVSSVVAKVNGSSVSATVSDDGSTVDIELPPGLAGKDKTWRLTLDYKSQIVSDLGRSKVIQIPTLNNIGLAITSQRTVISADLTIGLAVALPTPDKTDIAVGEQIFIYENKTGPVVDAVTLIFGSAATVVVDISTELKNDSWWWQTMELTLPPDTNQQQVILSSLEPKPSNVRLDQDGNILAQYRLGPRGSVDVVARAIVNVKNLNYPLDSKETLGDINPSLVNLYTAQTDKWSGDKIETNINPTSPVSEIIQTIYDTVLSFARTQTVLKNNQDLASTNIDSSGKYANLLIGELRQAGVPARAILGKLISDGQFILSDSRNHIWVEAYIPGSGWLTIDPALSVFGNHFGNSGVLHVGLALWGVSDSLPPVNLDSMNVVYSLDAFEIPEQVPVLSAVKTVIFPGVSIMNVRIEMPPGIITDGNALLKFDGQIKMLGSLAPMQNIESETLRFGAAAFNSEEVKYGYTFDGQTLTTEIATVHSTTNYTVLIVGTLLSFLGAAWLFFAKKRWSDSKYKPSKDSLIMHDEESGGDVENMDMVGGRSVKDEAPPLKSPPPVVTKPKPAPKPSKTKHSTSKPPKVEPPITRGTIASSNSGSGFQKPSAKNPRRHIVQ